ncbi:cell division protein, SpoIID family, putative [Citrifermentans bemidjiense Bem]|uniref:Cell division protein, SpoIID family, putative n=1 Tax=Citrifermentans bemidjiense (strain ATCC BAA-1014 / DSM 16622 / JCM 12645 / Bem) TaxID=404380 RepID=B5EFY0_CITBB|nr:SpoIID/LytB domain-containing protein [Citrifermentans bemidjiense]ACH39445.1 cell division protein, SpoIID family, putative [Citrifermentans bemidjiense Bem]
MSLFRALIILVICLAAGGSVAAMRPETVRVALSKGVDSVRIDGSGVLLTDGRGEPLDLEMPLEVKRSFSGVSVNGKSVDRLIAVAPGRLSVNGKGYRAVVEVSPAQKGLLVVNDLPLEEYLVGLINCEISSAWPMEAVKAQAVIARSYAVYQMQARRGAPYQLESSVMDQVYEGADVEDSRAARGVEETAGQVLTYEGKTIQAFYHSNCAGHTENSKNVWGMSIPYLQGVACLYCGESNPIKWELKLPLKKVESALRAAGYQVAGIRECRVRGRNDSGRVQDVLVDSSRSKVAVPGVAFRKALGYGAVKSTNFELRQSGDELLVVGSGSGHGVGLCQWGAKGRAIEGFDYREILSYYYPGVKLAGGYGR